MIRTSSLTAGVVKTYLTPSTKSCNGDVTPVRSAFLTPLRNVRITAEMRNAEHMET